MEKLIWLYGYAFWPMLFIIRSMSDGTVSSIFRNTVLHILAVLLLGFLAYSNTFNSPFFFDDKHNIVENPIVKDLKYFTSPSSAEGFAQSIILKRRFVGYLSFALDYEFHGLDVRGFHLVNLTIHILAALAVYLLVRLTFLTPRLEGTKLKGLSPYIGLAAALMFVSHPLQTQAVTYIVQRFASLAALFYIAAVALYAGARLSKSRGKRPGLYFLALGLTVLAMETKQNAFTLPLMIALYDVVFFRDTWRKRAIWLLPFALTMAIIPLIYLSGGGTGGDIIGTAEALTTIQNIPRGHYLMTEFRVLVTYLRLLLLPVGQNLYYDYPVYTSFFNPNVLLSFLLLAGLFAMGIYLTIKPGRDEPAFRVAGFGIIWFFIAHVVESTLIPLYVIFEHRMYLPSAGLFITIAVLGTYAYNRFNGVRKPIVAALVVVPLVLTWATYARNRIWQSEVSFWQDVTRKSPDNSAAFTNLANAYKNRGDMQESMNYLQKALEINQNNDVAHSQMGLLLENSGDEDAAVKEYLRALEINPSFVAARNNLGKVYLEQGKYGAAIEQYEKSLLHRPDNPIALSNLGYAYNAQGDYDKALEFFKKAVKFDPDFSDAYVHMGNAYVEKDMLKEAVDAFRKAVEKDPNNASARFNLANSFLRMGDFERATEEFARVTKQTPNDPDAFFALGAAWFSAKKFGKAIPPLRQAISLNPQMDRPYLVLALCYINEGAPEKAKQTYESLLKIHPNHPAALRGLKHLEAR